MKQKARLKKELLICLTCLIILITSIILIFKNKETLAAVDDVNDLDYFINAPAKDLLGQVMLTGGASENMTYRLLRDKGQYGCLAHKDDEYKIDTNNNIVNSVYDVVLKNDTDKNGNNIKKLAIESVGRGMGSKTAYQGTGKNGKAVVNLALQMTTTNNMNAVYRALRKCADLDLVVKDAVIVNGDENIVAGRWRE